jgi:hypothetical protein
VHLRSYLVLHMDIPPFGWLAICLFAFIHDLIHYIPRATTYFVCHLEEIEHQRPLIPKHIISFYELNCLNSTKSTVNNVLAIKCGNTIIHVLPPSNSCSRVDAKLFVTNKA